MVVVPSHGIHHTNSIIQDFPFSTLKPRYNEPRNSEFLDIVNKTQLPFYGFTKHITFDIEPVFLVLRVGVTS